MKQFENHLVDPLTGLKNRQFAENYLYNRLTQVQTGAIPPFPLLFFDIDSFTALIDRYGHVAGDIVLPKVGSLLCRKPHDKDVAIYWGGDRFILVLNSPVQGSHLYDVANRLSFLISKATFTVQKQLFQITVSIGTTLSKPEDSVDTLIYRAQQLTHVSKRGGGGDIGLG